ncbi:MAG: hypothetical protein AAGJ79_10925 [Verrucomicrobiota bacterium]
MKYLESRGIDLALTDESGGGEIIYSNIRAQESASLERVESVSVADREWKVRAVASKQYIDLKETWHGYGVLVAGLLATALAAGYVSRGFKRWR